MSGGHSRKILKAPAFFERSQRSLRKLRLDWISLSDKDVISLLRLNPTLEELCIREIRRKAYAFAEWVTPRTPAAFEFQDIITPSLLNALHVYNHVGSAFSPPLVSRLEKLDFAADGELFDDGDDCFEMDIGTGVCIDCVSSLLEVNCSLCFGKTASRRRASTTSASGNEWSCGGT
ncbi:hypothetical protein D9758_005523 [Tetrapyrgos nigripes]|uniref:Uncharacterized protein n=1 Tax=Tetrapyrgos nigripes TaxID=182062 RepID=A0A8H5LNX4_9AGAR|nr:hypothetical protein D9758_005523 [Tetrapyrgos nigripes]